MFCVWTISAHHNKHCTGRYQDIREDQVDQKQTGGTQSTKTYQRWCSPGKKQRWQLLTDTDGVECGPMCPVGCRMNQGPRPRQPNDNKFSARMCSCEWLFVLVVLKNLCMILDLCIRQSIIQQFPAFFNHQL